VGREFEILFMLQVNHHEERECSGKGMRPSI
jgi:hypothetical protein